MINQKNFPIDGVVLFSRILIASRFISSTIIRSGIWNPSVHVWDWTLADFQGKGIPSATIALALAFAWQTIGGLLILIGFKTRFACVMVALFVIATNFMFHRFWAVDDEQKVNFLTQFFKDVAVLGGIFLLMVTGPGKYSLDERLRRRKSSDD